MKTGLGASASIEVAMLNAATVQLVRQFIGIPTEMFGPQTDSVIVDGQSIMEKVFNFLLPLLSGSNIISGAGHIETVGTVSLLQLIIDNEMQGMARRLLEGIEVNDDTLALDTINEYGIKGSFLESNHTLKYFKKEHYMPNILSRTNWEAWKQNGSKDLNKRATEFLEYKLRNHKVVSLSDDLNIKIKDIVSQV